MKKTRSFFFASLVTCLPIAAAQAEPPLDAENLMTTELQLAELLPMPHSLRLSGASGEYRIGIPYSPRTQLARVVLELHWTNSIAVVDNRSQLSVSLNDRVLGQAVLYGQKPEGRLLLQIPSELLQEGYNALSLRVIQHYAQECEDPSAPELWTEINLVDSVLRLSYQLGRIRPSLSDIAQLVAPDATRRTFGVAVLAPPDAQAQPEFTEIGARVSAGLALRLRHVPLVVDTGTIAPLPLETETPVGTARLAGEFGQDVVLAGTRDQLRTVLPDDMVEEITGAYIGILALASEPHHFALVISGTSSSEVMQAAKAFSLAQLPLPDRQGLLVSRVEFPALPVYGHAAVMLPETRYPFHSFGMQTTTMGDDGPDRIRFQAWLPPDLFVPADANLKLNLRLAYGAGADPSSSLAVFINGLFMSSVRLGSPEGGVYRDYMLALPASWLRAGDNEIEFRSFMKPQGTGTTCFRPSERGLLVTLFEDSWMSLTAARHYVSVPDLDLFARTGFPYTVPADGSALHLGLAAQDADTRAAAWTLFGKLAQRAGTPLQRASFGAPDVSGEGTRHQLVIGSADAIPAALWKQAPLQIGEQSLLQAEVLSVPKGTRDSATLSSWLPQGSAISDNSGRDFLPAGVEVSMVGMNKAWLMQFESPVASSTVVTLATARSNAHLRANIQDLVGHAQWGSLRGATATWSVGQELVTSTAGPRFSLGSADLKTRANRYFSDRLLLWNGLIVGSVMLFAFVSVILLRFRRKRQA